MFNAKLNSKTNLDLPDEDVVRLILEIKSPKMMSVLYERYANKVYRKCITFFDNCFFAQDITQDIPLALSQVKKEKLTEFATLTESIN